MTALPDLNVTGAGVGQTFTVDFRNNIVSATLGQQYGDASDMLLIYNLSPCNFQVMLTATNRTFNLPAGVTSNPIPLSYRGTSDVGLKLTVKSLVVSGTPNTVSFDWFRPGEPILAAPASSQGLGTVNLSSISAASVTFPTPNNWVIAQDGSGNLTFTDTTVAGAEVFFDGSANLHLPNSTVANVDGQATVGNYGVPLTVGQPVVLRTHVASTSPVSPINIASVSASSIYRVSGFFTLDRASGAGTISIIIAWTDTILAAGQNANMTGYNSGASFSSLLNGTSTPNGFSYALNTLTMDVASGTAFSVTYLDSAAGPNDYVSFIVERLA